MPFFDNYLTSLPEYRSLENALKKDRLPCGVTGVSHVHRAHIITALCRKTERRGLVLVGDEAEGAKLCSDINAMGGKALLLPARDFDFRPNGASSREYEQERLFVLSKALEGDYGQIIACIDSAMEFTISPERLFRMNFTLCSGQEISPDSVVEKLLSQGYVRCTTVEGPGQFAKRGGILDIFTPDKDLPTRIEFWGDEIDCISSFDVLTQRRNDSFEQINVPPAREILIANPDGLAQKLESAVKRLRSQRGEKSKQQLLSDAELLKTTGLTGGLDRFIPFIEDCSSTIFDYTADALLFVSDTAKVKEKARVFHWQLAEDIKTMFEEGLLCKGLDKFALTFEEICQKYTEQGAVFLDSFARGSFDVPIKELCSFTVKTSTPFSGNLSQLCDDLEHIMSRGFAVAILAGNKKSAEILAEDLRNKGFKADYQEDFETVPYGKVAVLEGNLSGGFEYLPTKFVLITESKRCSVKTVKRKKNPNAFNSLDELNKGDYVVHAVHGIGIFEGIRKIESNGIVKDYITINYAGKDVLYVPVTQLDLVSKYIGAGGDEVKVKLNKLGGSDWQRTRSRVKSAVKDIAKELIRLYSARMNTKGYAFGPDIDMQNDFERRFEFEETDDQLRCIDEIKYDMMRPVPMDRLLCGDVGFGKTEVALRAAFKCIAEGKQCALLVPTTILAWQHYQTVLRRMDGMPVNIELLSRFRTPSQQNETIKRLYRGETDMVIGTHRLISDDVKFRDLGLLIVDEEQRFGVAQKEKLKEKFKAVDVLTLSATPIPRTLNMAMSGLRDMSVIEEAPLDRHPVQTYVCEYDSGVISDAIRRELRRGGQVYYLHNRVDNIERVALSLKERIPEAKVGVAHGKMNEEELSRVWKALIENEIDLLVCTTIIETGVDVPNANTLIIEDADKMGLAQLHQIRGRVGRSARRAYAYLTFRRGKELSDIADRRLSAIREFTEFGSGLKIAMRDLEIRGAGNLLGAEQHGQMAAVGYDMYLKLLSDAVKEEKGEKTTESLECTVDIQIPAHIPEDYITDLPTRLSIYRRIADIRSEQDSEDVFDELIDRFGEPPKPVVGLVTVALLRGRAAALGIYEVSQQNGCLLLYQQNPDVGTVLKAADNMRGRLLLNAGNKPYISVKLLSTQSPLDALREVLSKLEAAGKSHQN